MAQYSSGTTYFVHTDHLGSTRLVTSLTGAVSDSLDFLPFGEQQAGGSLVNYKFTGKERDGESGLDNFEARYFASTLGRFMTPDWAARPIAVPYALYGDPQSLNLYTYVRNDPVTRIDADGHAEPCPTENCGGGKSADPALIDESGQKPEPQNTSGKTIAKGAGEVGLGGAAIGLAIVLAPETGGGSLAALGVAAGVLGGTAEVGNGIVDIAHGAGQVDAQTAEEAKQGINIANNPVAANALIVTNAENAERIGNVANGVMALHDIAKRPEGVADAFSKLMGARDVKEGYQGAKELMHQVGSYLQEKAPSLYQYF